MPATMQANDWLVFIDGVQVPYQGITMSFGVDAVARGSFLLSPDIILARIRARAVIAIFCRDRYSSLEHKTDVDELLDGYFYFGGGELTGHEDTKDPQNRQFSLSFEADLGILDTHQAFALGLGGNHHFGQIVGTSLINPIDLNGNVGAEGLLKVAALGTVFKKDGATSNREKLRSLSGDNETEEDFALRMVRLLSWFSASNASLRMHVTRSRLLSKVVGVQDKVLDSLITSKFATQLMSEVSQEIGPSGTILDILRGMMRHAGYHITTIPLPKDAGPVSGNEAEVVPIPSAMESSSREGGRLRRTWYRNDYAFVPNLFYSPPPPCNLIFPDMIGGRTISRSLSSEATRSVYEDSFFPKGSRLVFVHTDGLSENLDGKTPDLFWANFARSMTVGRVGKDAVSDSAYVSSVSIDRGSTTVPSNLLSTVSDEEFEKGILVRMQSPNAEYALAFARSLELKKLDGKINKVALESIRPDLQAGATSKNSKYFQYVQQWLKHTHQLNRFNRPTSVTLKGHRWLAPGFSAVIFDDIISYQGYVKGTTITVDADGNENTQVELDYVRPLTPYNKELYARVQATLNKVDSERSAANDELQVALNSETARAEDELATMLGEVAFGTGATKLESGEFAASYDYLTLTANDNADAMLGPGKTVAGVVTSTRAGDIARMHTEFLSKDSIQPVDGDDPDTAIATAKRAVAAISAYNQAQLDNVALALPAQGNTREVIDAINSASTLLARTEQQLADLVAEISDTVDFPTPPDFYNEDFINLKSVDKMYQDVLGCRPFYTGPYGEAATDGEEDSKEKGTSYVEHVKMLKTLSRVYRGIADQVNMTDNRSDTATRSWEDVKAGKDHGGTMGWQHRQFLKRDAMTLRSYLSTHGFTSEMAVLVSDEPSPTVFYRMVPVTVDQKAKSGYSWDNSVISGLVDDRQIAPLPVTDFEKVFIDGVLDDRNIVTRSAWATFSPNTDQFVSLFAASGGGSGPVTYFAEDFGLDGQDPDEYVVTAVVINDEVVLNADRIPASVTFAAIPVDDDPLVTERREAAGVRLVGGFRQDVLVEYSRKHFGSRGLAGS